MLGSCAAVALVRALIVNIAVFGVLKYAGFLIANVNTVLALLDSSPAPGLVIPIAAGHLVFHLPYYFLPG